MGFDRADWAGKPVIAVVNTWSEINPCHTHLRERAQDVKRGVWQAGGFPLELPALSLAEPFQKPTTMLYRNLLAMEVEELLRSYPIDGAVLLGGCDKTTPGLLMGAVERRPAGDLRARRADAARALARAGARQRLGRLAAVGRAPRGHALRRRPQEVEERIARSPGHCMTMGTASTMTAAAEALGVTLPGASSIPAADAAHPRMAAASGRRIVALVREGVTARGLLTAAAFENAIAVVLALGGSTNAVIHLVALARRAGVPLGLDRFDARSREVPVLANIRPSGAFLMEDFFEAGGLRALMARLGDHLDGTAATVGGCTLGEAVAGAEVFDDRVIRPLDDPLSPEGGLAVLRGSLAPDGAVIKHIAASPQLLRHTGRAVVFEDRDDLAARIDDPDLAVDEGSVLVLRGAGPLGGPGMPEWGQLPIPKRLLERGVRDLVRISDARMSGTSYGTCVLHVAPEAHVGGPLALVRDGDPIVLDVPGRRLDLDVDPAELERRRAAWSPPPVRAARGWQKLFAAHVTQADQGCDFDFLEGAGGVPEPAIH